MNIKNLMALGACALLAATVQAEVKLNSMFCDHAVLQRNKPLPVWGSADVGETITVSFAGQNKTVTTGQDGRWGVTLSALPASSEGRSLTVASNQGGQPIVLVDVVVGDVWICSGQSNMSFVLQLSSNAATEITDGTYPLFRHIKIAEAVADTPESTVICRDKGWVPASPEWRNVGNFTAVGYFFGLKLHKELNIPIGLIGANWGGTKIEPWIAPEGYKRVPELKNISDKVEESLLNGSSMGASHQEPTRIYNAMIHPLVPYAIRGVIWYQGEGNGGEGVSYFHKMRALIEGWRKLWNQGDFPFYFVQLANYQNSPDTPAGGDGWAKIREAQRQALTIPNTGMAVSIDVGEANDIHPKNKQDVGVRLAAWALAHEYGKDVVASGPLYKSHVVTGNAIHVSFDYAGGGLMVASKQGLAPPVEVKGGKLAHFSIAGADKVWHWAEGTIDGDTVIVSSTKVPSPVAVRYAFRMNPEGVNFYNRTGLPASPFRTDNW
jgi:sialate O-acetylesterase